MTTNHLHFAFCCTLVALLSSCGVTRYVPDETYLLKKYEISGLPQKSISPYTITSYIRQRPNSSLLFGWKFRLAIYNMSPRSESGWSNFLKEMGEAPVILDLQSIESSKLNIDRYITSQGYYFNTITDSIVYKKKQATVYLNFNLGKQYTVSTTNWVISDSIMRSFVLSDTLNSLLKHRPIFSEALLELESERITYHLRERGYYNLTKNHISFVADTLQGNDSAVITVHFKEGNRSDEMALAAAPQQRFKIETIHVYPDWQPEKPNTDSLQYKGMVIHFNKKLKLRSEVLARLNRLETGSYYNEQVVNTTYNRFSSLRLFSGVTLQFDALNTHSLPHQAAPDKPDNIPVPDEALHCQIRLTPSKVQGYKINLEASSNSSGLIGISPALSYFHKNIFKGGEWLTMSFSGNFQFKFNNAVKSKELGASTTLTFPMFLLPVPHTWFNNHTPQTDINTSYSFQQRPEFIRNILSVNFGYNWRGGERLHYRFAPIQLNIVRLYNVDSTFYKSLHDPFLINSYQDHFDLGSSFTLFYTTDNSPVPQNSYFYFRWTTDLSGNSLELLSRKKKNVPSEPHLLWGTAYSQYWRSELNSVYTWKPVPEHSVAARLYGGVGVAYGNSNALPFEKLFYAGGANSLRAWQARAIGPGSMPLDTTFSIPNQTGDVKLEANVEYRPKLFWKLEGALFLDAGNIWTLRQDLGREAGAFRLKDFHKSIAVAGGVGIRLNLEFVLLRIDMGVVLHDACKQKWVPASQWLKPRTYSIQFGVGYPFL